MQIARSVIGLLLVCQIESLTSLSVDRSTIFLEVFELYCNPVASHFLTLFRSLRRSPISLLASLTSIPHFPFDALEYSSRAIVCAAHTALAGLLAASRYSLTNCFPRLIYPLLVLGKKLQLRFGVRPNLPIHRQTGYIITKSIGVADSLGNLVLAAQ